MRNLKLLTCFLAFALGSAACSQDEIVYPEADVEAAKSYLSLQQLADNPVELPSGSGTYTLKVVSEKKWKLSASEAWCTLSTSEGFKYTEIPINFSENPWNKERSAVLNFSIAETGEYFTLNVTQVAAATTLQVSPDNLSFGVGGGTQKISLKTNATDCRIAITDKENQPVDWCTMDGYIGQGSADINITADGNTTGEIREAKITFTAEEITQELTVSQLDKFEAPVIELDEAVSFNVTWNEILNVSGYELRITDENDLPIDGISNLTLPAGTTSYKLSNIDWKEYVGKIKVCVAASMMIEESLQTQVSNTVEAHNYFDMSSGDGTENSPYIVRAPRHLTNIGKFLDKENVWIRQDCDIDLTGVDFEPINNLLADNEYQGKWEGVYDAGKGEVADPATGRTAETYRILNMSINRTGNISCGLFAKIGEKGTVRNLCIENPVVKAKYKAGTIAGETSGHIVNCSNQASAGSMIYGDSGDNLSYAYVGGIVGNMTGGKIEYCRNYCVINGKSGALGGIAGRVQILLEQYPEIAYCSNFATVNTDTKTPVGGIVGDIGASGIGTSEYALVDHCYNEGAISGAQANNQVGGIIGRTTSSAKVNACHNAGSVTAVGSAGGMIGRMGGTVIREISNCLNTGNVSSTGDTKTPTNNNAGGILATGLNAGAMSMTNCLNVGEITTISGYENGLLQRMDNATQTMAMSGCYALDKEKVRQTTASDEDIENPQSAYKNISEDAARLQETFEGWDFTDVWELSNGMYPTIKGLLK